MTLPECLEELERQRAANEELIAASSRAMTELLAENQTLVRENVELLNIVSRMVECGSAGEDASDATCEAWDNAVSAAERLIAKHEGGAT